MLLMVIQYLLYICSTSYFYNALLPHSVGYGYLEVTYPEKASSASGTARGQFSKEGGAK